MASGDVSLIRRIIIEALCRIGGFFLLCWFVLHIVARHYPAFLIAHHHPNLFSLLLIYGGYFLGFYWIKRSMKTLRQTKSEKTSCKR